MYAPGQETSAPDEEAAPAPLLLLLLRRALRPDRLAAAVAAFEPATEPLRGFTLVLRLRRIFLVLPAGVYYSPVFFGIYPRVTTTVRM